MAGCVSLISTPIGNLGDISFRAVECLKRADVIACEDTRHSSRLLKHIDVSGKELIALHEHNEERRSATLVERAMQGDQIVYLSDAGTPTISDPGYRLVNRCIEASLKVEVIPGPSAVTTALAGSGMPSDAFYFGGFLPVKSGRRQKVLEEALSRSETSIFFESPHRILKSLLVVQEIAPERPVCVARELTKKFETFHRGTASEILSEFAEGVVKGEITLLLRGLGKAKRKAEKE